MLLCGVMLLHSKSGVVLSHSIYRGPKNSYRRGAQSPIKGVLVRQMSGGRCSVSDSVNASGNKGVDDGAAPHI